MPKSQVKGSKRANKPPSQHGNGGSIAVFTHRRRWRLCHDSRTKRNSAAQCGTQKCRSNPYRLTPTRYRNLIPWLSGMIQGVLWYLQFLLVYYACTFRNVKATSIVTQLVIFSSKPRSVLSRKSVFSVGNAIRYITGRRFELLMQEDHVNVCPAI